LRCSLLGNLGPAALEKRRVTLQRLLHGAVRAAQLGGLGRDAHAHTLEFLEVPEFIWG
jgi:hypothetical protein